MQSRIFHAKSKIIHKIYKCAVENMENYESLFMPYTVDSKLKVIMIFFKSQF